MEAAAASAAAASSERESELAGRVKELESLSLAATSREESLLQRMSQIKEAADEELEAMSRRLSASEADSAARADALEALHSQCETLRARLAALRPSVSSAAAADDDSLAASKHQELLTALNQLEEASEAKSSLQAELLATQQAASSLRAEVDDLRVRNEHAQALVRRRTTELQATREALDKARTEAAHAAQARSDARETAVPPRPAELALAQLQTPTKAGLATDIAIPVAGSPPARPRASVPPAPSSIAPEAASSSGSHAGDMGEGATASRDRLGLGPASLSWRTLGRAIRSGAMRGELNKRGLQLSRTPIGALVLWAIVATFLVVVLSAFCDSSA